MNNSEVAKNGFKTFLITLLLTLVLFSVVYYLASDSSLKVDIEKGDTSNVVSVKKDATTVGKVAAVANDSSGEFVVKQSAFEALNKQKTASPLVLGAASTETTQSTVPATGTTEITYAFVASLCLTAFGFYMLVVSPRKKALANFERNVTGRL
ncbi:MAG: hypothetical protein ACD_22C00100G0010 [uncultured bacterium]|nr:MAG: hypothetical protein ACD_22C00100G0010 [uncultured bacterium]